MERGMTKVQIENKVEIRGIFGLLQNSGNTCRDKRATVQTTTQFVSEDKWVVRKQGTSLVPCTVCAKLRASAQIPKCPFCSGLTAVQSGREIGFGRFQFVAFLDIKEKEGSWLETHLLHKFGALRSKFIKCDIADEAQLVAAFQLVLDKCRRLDVVINNAAVLADDEEFRKMADINFVGTVSSTLKAIDVMTAEKGGDGGTVLNISSLLALKHHSRLPVYSATKAAVLHFSNSIGAEDCYANSKVRVMTVCLGPTDTAILQRQNLANFDKDCAKSLTSRVPVRQRVESAVNGIIEVIQTGTSGSTWVVANDDLAEDITDSIKKAYGVMPKIVD